MIVKDLKCHIKMLWFNYPTLYSSQSAQLLSTFSKGGEHHIDGDGNLVFEPYGFNVNLKHFKLTAFQDNSDWQYPSIEKKFKRKYFKFIEKNYDELWNFKLNCGDGYVNYNDLGKHDECLGIKPEQYFRNYYLINLCENSLLRQLNEKCDKELLQLGLDICEYWLTILHRYNERVNITETIKTLIKHIDDLRGWLGMNSLTESNQKMLDVINDILNEVE